MLKKFLVRGTGTEFDHAEVGCGPPRIMTYIQESGKASVLSLRQVETVCYPDDSEDDKLNGVWMETGYLIEVAGDESEEPHDRGKFIKEYCVNTFTSSIVLVHYENILQVVVKKADNENHIISQYKRDVHFGTIKYMMDEFNNSSDVKEFIEKLKELI